MRGQNNFSVDSDQSISDEEDFIQNWPKNPNQGGKNKQLEIFSLKDDPEMAVSRNGEVEFIQSLGKFSACISDEENISDEEKNCPSNSSFISKCMKPQKVHSLNFMSEQQDGASTWSTVLKETEELIYVQEKAGCLSSHHANSEAKRTCKGSRGKGKAKFSIHFRTHQEEPPVLIMVGDEKEESSDAPQVLKGFDDLELKTTVQSMTDLLEVFQEETEKQSGDHKAPSKLSSLNHRDTMQSVADIMEGLQEKSGPPKETSKMSRKSMRFLHPGKKNTTTLGDRTFDKEAPSEPVDSGTSSENEVADFLLQDTDEEKLKLATTEINGQTVANKFLEALDAAIENNGQTFKTSKLSMGFHGRLQQVIQTEKETHMYFLKRPQAENSDSDEARCIDVRILSRYLDAKLTVCECSLMKNAERPQCTGNPEKLMDSGERRVIIFNSKICGNVGLEIGKAIHICPPWKEVELMESGGSIILCAYFSQIGMTSPVSL